MWGWISGSSAPENPHIIEGLPTPTKDEEYQSLGQTSLAKFLEMTQETAGWEDVAFTDPAGGNIKIQSKIVEGSAVQAARATVIIDATPEKLVSLAVSKNLEEAKRLEADALVYDLIKTVPGGIEIVYTAQNLPFPLASREALHCRITKTEANGTINVASTSINDANVKLGDGRVRSVIIISGYSFVPLADGKTQVTRLVQLDPRGSIPTFVVNSYISKVGTSLANLRALAK